MSKYKFSYQGRKYVIQADSQSQALDKLKRLYGISPNVSVKAHKRKIVTQPTNCPIKIGDLFYTSWGYDQTNYDYIVVVGVSPTCKTALCRRTSYEEGESRDITTYAQRPVNRPFGETFRMIIKRSYNGSIVLTGSYPFLPNGVGSKRRDSFSRVDPGRYYYETNTQFGH